MEAAGLNNFLHCLKSHERDFSKLTETRYSLRRRADGDCTD
jgi:hypothetical protein